MVKSVLEVPGKIEVIPIKYGCFDVVRFWFPFWTRKVPIERVSERDQGRLAKVPKNPPGHQAFGHRAQFRYLRYRGDP